MHPVPVVFDVRIFFLLFSIFRVLRRTHSALIRKLQSLPNRRIVYYEQSRMTLK